MSEQFNATHPTEATTERLGILTIHATEVAIDIARVGKNTIINPIFTIEKLPYDADRAPQEQFFRELDKLISAIRMQVDASVTLKHDDLLFTNTRGVSYSPIYTTCADELYESIKAVAQSVVQAKISGVTQPKPAASAQMQEDCAFW